MLGMSDELDKMKSSRRRETEKDESKKRET